MRQFARMDPIDVLKFTILALALLGYLHCLARFLRATLAATVALALYLGQVYPFGGIHLPHWIAAAVALLVLIVLAQFLKEKSPPAETPRTRSRTEQRHIVIDGTNVLYWDGQEADLATLRSVVDTLKHRHYDPYVFLDASSRHHLCDTTLNETAFARQLGLPRKRVMVCPAKTEADAFILAFARQEGLAVVSNDRFGDRAAQKKGLKLIKGVMANGKPLFDGL